MDLTNSNEWEIPAINQSQLNDKLDRLEKQLDRIEKKIDERKSELKKMGIMYVEVLKMHRKLHLETRAILEREGMRNEILSIFK